MQVEKYGYPVSETTTEGKEQSALLIWAIDKNAACLFIIGAFLYFCSRLIKNRKE